MKLVIYGAGGLGKEITGLLRSGNFFERWDFIGFIDDGKPVGTRVGDAVVLGGINWLTSVEEPVAVVMGLSAPYIKASLYEKLSALPGINFPVIIHPSANVEPSASLAPGTVISPFCLVEMNASLGTCSYIGAAAQVCHDSTVGNFCSVMPSVNISGNVTIGTRTLVGLGAKILQGLKIGADTTVGIGSVVLSDVPDNCTVIGYPAKVSHYKKTGEDGSQKQENLTL